MSLLKLGAAGSAVVALQRSLRRHKFDPGPIDGEFGPATQAALMAFQRGESLLPDGIAGKATAAALGLPSAPPPADVTAHVTARMVSPMFPGTPIGAIEADLPRLLIAMHDAGLGDKPMVLTALATIRAEAASFEPVEEGVSRFNTSPNGPPFDLYDYRKDLGNRGAPDGANFRGRGFVQLTGRANYTVFGARLDAGVDLVDHPGRASDSAIAARLLALFLKDKEPWIREALLEDDLGTARRLVNGGSHGLQDFADAFRAGEQSIPDEA